MYLDNDENWKDELSYFVEDSQVAQAHALRACAALLIGAAGSIRDAAKNSRMNKVMARLKKRTPMHRGQGGQLLLSNGVNPQHLGAKTFLAHR